MSGPVITLSGGVGGAKLVLGLSQIVHGNGLIVACNTGDDFDHLSLKICPDIDSVLYALAGLSDQERGWGRRDETWTFMSALRGLKEPGWFNLGDGDLATHVFRTDLLRQGRSLSEATRELAARHDVSAIILPMSDDPVATIVKTKDGDLDFQTYFVREQCQPDVIGIEFAGIDRACPQPLVLDALQNGPQAIVIAPSNPYVSVDPILNLPGMRAALKAADAPIVAVSPIVGGRALKGPAAKMMKELGKDVSVLGIAGHYRTFIDGLVLDVEDADLAPEIQAMGIDTLVTQTVMTKLESKAALARETLAFARRIAR